MFGSLRLHPENPLPVGPPTQKKTIESFLEQTQSHKLPLDESHSIKAPKRGSLSVHCPTTDGVNPIGPVQRGDTSVSATDLGCSSRLYLKHLALSAGGLQMYLGLPLPCKECRLYEKRSMLSVTWQYIGHRQASFSRQAMAHIWQKHTLHRCLPMRPIRRSSQETVKPTMAGVGWDPASLDNPRYG